MLPDGKTPYRNDSVARLLRVDEVAERLAISRSMAWRLTAEGRLPVVRIGRAIRIRPADLEAYIEAAVGQ